MEFIWEGRLSIVRVLEIVESTQEDRIMSWRFSATLFGMLLVSCMTLIAEERQEREEYKTAPGATAKERNNDTFAQRFVDPQLTKQINLPRQDLIYTADEGFVVMAKNSPMAYICLQLPNQKLQGEDKAAFVSGSFYASAELRVEGWTRPVKGWIYDTGLQEEGGPESIFLANKANSLGERKTIGKYGVAFFKRGRWTSAFYAKRNKPHAPYVFHE